MVIVVAGDAKVDNHRYKMAFHEKAHMIPAPDVERLTGHVPGGVCPVALKDGVTLYFDESLKRFTDSGVKPRRSGRGYKPRKPGADFI